MKKISRLLAQLANQNLLLKVGIYLIILAGIFLADIQSASAQLQTEFGQSLLERKPETPEADPAELTISSHFSNTFNNHIELG